MDNIIYRLKDGSMWNVNAAKWIDLTTLSADEQASNSNNIINLISADGQSDVEYLAKTLASYDYPLGELVMYSEKGIKEELARLDAEYLTPRTLADLSANNLEAKERYDEHERLAKPLRERLAQLEAEKITKVEELNSEELDAEKLDELETRHKFQYIAQKRLVF